MNENEKDRNGKGKGGKTPDQTKRKGFYAALYSCVGLMLTLAVVIGYRNMMMDESSMVPDPDSYAANASADYPVNNSNEKPGSFGYLTPEDRAANYEIGEPLLESTSNDAAMTTPATVVPRPDTAAPATEAPNAAVPAATSTPGINEIPTAGTEVPPTGSPENQPSVWNESNGLIVPEGDKNRLTNNVNYEEDNTPEMVAHRIFNEGDTMTWPVTGEVVMAFSADHVIYDRTLDQYRTNDSLSIAAALGTEVRAAAEGVVTEITSSRENGRTVVVDHGNGWRTTYSQLQDNVPVSVGSVVRQGQILGGVGEPSLYSVLLGPHLEFAVLKDNVALNPKDVLVRE